jgi:hypothetical protein
MKNSDFGLKDYHETNTDDVWKTFEMIHQNSKDFQLFSSVCKYLKNLEKCKKNGVFSSEIKSTNFTYSLFHKI